MPTVSNHRSALCFLSALSALVAPTYAQVEVQKLTASDAQPGDQFGAVAVHGTTVVVGAGLAGVEPLDSGAAYVFELGAGGWVESTTLRSADAAVDDTFGASVALTGEMIVVGALSADGQTPDAGAVYVFEQAPAGGWEQTAKLEALDGFTYDGFGGDVDIWSNRVIVGAHNTDDDGESSGSAYVFERFGPQWIQTARFTAPDAEEFDRFGTAVAILGDVAMVGADGDNDLAPSSGSVYVYERTDTGWVLAQKLLPSSGSFLAGFGAEIDLETGRAVIGAPGSNIAAGIASGAAYVFERSPAGWVETQLLLAPDASSADQFGAAVAVQGDTLLIGAWNSGETGFEPGAVYVFELGETRFVPASKLLAGDADHGARFGSSVGIEGETIVVGAVFDAGAGDFAGAAYVFEEQGFATPYCFCQAGPCGNDDPTAGCSNSVGSGALLAADGSASIANDDLVLRATGLPAGTNGIVYMGGAPAHMPLADGVRCVDWGGVGIFRYPIQTASANGELSVGPGLVATSHALFGPSGSIAVGQTWYFQTWYRDASGPCGLGNNHSNAVSVTFAP